MTMSDLDSSAIRARCERFNTATTRIMDRQQAVELCFELAKDVQQPALRSCLGARRKPSATSGLSRTRRTARAVLAFAVLAGLSWPRSGPALAGLRRPGRVMTVASTGCRARSGKRVDRPCLSVMKRQAKEWP